MRAHEVGVGLDLFDPLQGRRGHADSDGGQGVVAIERLGVGPPLAALGIGEDAKALGAHLVDGVARDALGFVGFLDAQEAIHHPQHVDAVALVIRGLQAVVRDFPLGFEHLGRIARQLEERGGLEVDRLLAKDGGRRTPLGNYGDCEEDHEPLHGWPLPATRASALPDLGGDPIDPLLGLDPGARGIARFFQTGGARRAADALRHARRVVLTTGFVVDTGVAETDGPPGAAVLGRALRALGAEVRYVTDAVTAPVVAGVSNWGAYGIVAHLGRAGGRALLHTPDDERRVVSACVAAGACDGVTRRREATVDGLPLEAHAALVTLLGLAAQARA